MEKQAAINSFEALASGVRLDIYRQLVRKAPAGEVAGQLAQELGIAPNNLSFHLKTLLHAGLISVEQEGRFQRYRANLSVMQALIAYLTAECCEGQPELCAVDSASERVGCQAAECKPAKS